ncbi:MAG: hypothetical protein J6M53_05820 [Bacteroidaceae bacterium]|nr:hypothetical protein [Bacteroidaceae bacterium]
MSTTLSIPVDLPAGYQTDELVSKLTAYAKKLVAKAVHHTPKNDPTLLTKEEFFAKVDASLAEYERGESRVFTDSASMNAWLNAL